MKDHSGTIRPPDRFTVPIRTSYWPIEISTSSLAIGWVWFHTHVALPPEGVGGKVPWGSPLETTSSVSGTFT